MNYKIVQVIPITTEKPKRARKPRKRKPSKRVPNEVLAELPKEQRAPFRDEVRRIGGWNEDRACTWKGPRRTWKSTKKYANQLADEVTPGGLDTLDRGSAVLHDAFCEQLDLHGKKCPASAKMYGGSNEGWIKAMRIGLGSKNRRFADLKNRPQWRAFLDALEQEGKQLLPLEVAQVEDHDLATEQCRLGHDRKIGELLTDARAGKLVRRKRVKVPF